MAKSIYSATVGETKITRSTNRTYTHAVVWVSKIGNIVKPQAFAGSLVLAQKQVGRYTSDRIYRSSELEALGLNPDDWEKLKEGNPEYRDVPGKIIIVPVELEA